MYKELVDQFLPLAHYFNIISREDFGFPFLGTDVGSVLRYASVTCCHHLKFYVFKGFHLVISPTVT